MKMLRCVSCSSFAVYVGTKWHQPYVVAGQSFVTRKMIRGITLPHGRLPGLRVLKKHTLTHLANCAAAAAAAAALPS